MDRPYIEKMSYFDSALTEDQNKAEIWNNKGILLEQLTEFDKAIQCYDNIDLKQKYPEILSNEGLTYIKMGEYKHAWHNKIITLLKADEIDDAERCIYEARQLGIEIE